MYEYSAWETSSRMQKKNINKIKLKKYKRNDVKKLHSRFYK